MLPTILAFVFTLLPTQDAQIGSYTDEDLQQTRQIELRSFIQGHGQA